MSIPNRTMECCPDALIRNPQGLSNVFRCHRRLQSLSILFVLLILQGRAVASPQSQQCTEEKACPSASVDSSECKLYLGESSIPNSGLGMYTAVGMKKGDHIGWPDFLIHVPVDDRPGYLFQDYYWNSWHYLPDGKNPGGLMPNLGMAANSHMALHNVEHVTSKLSIDGAGLHRNSSPGAGAISPYHNVTWYMTQDISAGSELFADYGEHYFLGREHSMGFIPLQEHYDTVDSVTGKMRTFLQTYSNEMTPNIKHHMWKILRDQIVDNERIRVALPQSVDDIETAAEMGSARFHLPNMVRSQEWLEQHAVCMDNLRPGQSTNAQAGRGAFATRFLRKGQRIASAPLVHIPDEYLMIHADVQDPVTLAIVPDQNTTIGYELILNYCFGHPKSSIRLFPYASWVYYINHDSANPNVEVRWSTTSAHKALWLQRPVVDVLKEPHAGLILDVVATRDILPGEEVVMDYGRQWEEAWALHVDGWQASTASTGLHVPSFEFDEHTPVRTIYEQQEEPYPENILITCYHSFPSGDDTIRDLSMGELEELHAEQIWEVAFPWRGADLLSPEQNYHPCQIVSRELSSESNEVLYLVSMTNGSGGFRFVKGVPRSGIRLTDRRFTTDAFLPNSFRHYIGLPDDIFPDAWINVR